MNQMTPPNQAHALPLQHLQEALAKRGLRLTAQRAAIYQYLRESHAHPTAEEVYAGLCERYPMLSPATVYNTLDLLKDLGLLTELGFVGSSRRYDTNPEPHLNVLCTICHRIVDLPMPQLAAQAGAIAAMNGFEVEYQRHEIFGRCPDCRVTTHGGGQHCCKRPKDA